MSISRIHQKLGTAGFVISIVALVAAMGGGAYAASGGLNGKQKKEVEKIAKKYAGKPGAAGPAGSNGSNGAKGDTGATGAEGKQGPKANRAYREYKEKKAHLGLSAANCRPVLRRPVLGPRAVSKARKCTSRSHSRFSSAPPSPERRRTSYRKVGKAFVREATLHLPHRQANCVSIKRNFRVPSPPASGIPLSSQRALAKPALSSSSKA